GSKSAQDPSTSGRSDICDWFNSTARRGNRSAMSSRRPSPTPIIDLLITSRRKRPAPSRPEKAPDRSQQSQTPFHFRKYVSDGDALAMATELRQSHFAAEECIR